MAVILNYFNPVPNPKIYLEEITTSNKNFAVSIIIDPSFSCFHELAAPHSLQTIKIILNAMIILDVNCFDLIIATKTKPIVLCSKISSIEALNINSPLWEVLFSLLQSPLKNIDLASGIHVVFDLKRMRSFENTNFLFILTDGLYQSAEKERIVQSVNNCVQNDMNVYGIGLGIYPVVFRSYFLKLFFHQIRIIYF